MRHPPPVQIPALQETLLRCPLALNSYVIMAWFVTQVFYLVADDPRHLGLSELWDLVS